MTSKQISDAISKHIANALVTPDTGDCGRRAIPADRIVPQHPAKEVAFQALVTRAHDAGMRSAAACVPTPMIVSEHGNPLDDSSPIVKHWVVNSGVCGFAWVNVKPGTSAFAKWLVKTGRARRDSYYGGVTIWVSDFNQSMELKEAYAYAYARVLADEGIKAYAASRMD